MKVNNYLVDCAILVSAIVHVTIMFNYVDIIFVRRNNIKLFLLIISFVINVLIGFISTIIVISPLLTGTITIIGWITLLMLYKGKFILKFLYMISFFVVNAVLELLSFYILIIENISYVDEFSRGKAFVISTIIGILFFLIFKHVFSFGNSKISWMIVISVYSLPVIGLIFDTVLFYRSVEYTVGLQVLIVICSLLLSVNSIFIVNKLGKNEFELQRYASLSGLYKEQQQKIKLLDKEERELSIQVHRSDEVLIKIYEAIQSNDVSLARTLIENRFLTLNTNLLRISNPTGKISMRLLIDKIKDTCDENGIEFISNYHSEDISDFISVKDQVNLMSVIFAKAFEDIVKQDIDKKFFEIKIYKEESRVSIFISYSKKMSLNQFRNFRYKDFARKDYGLKFIDLIVKKYLGHVSLKITGNSFGILITLINE